MASAKAERILISGQGERKYNIEPQLDELQIVLLEDTKHNLCAITRDINSFNFLHKTI